MKPLFIPLKTEYYETFANGSKTSELRRYGPRWNERTCTIGRPVVLSKGYGKGSRMTGRITQFGVYPGSMFGDTHRDAIESLFGSLDVEIAEITIELDDMPSPSNWNAMMMTYIGQHKAI